MGPARIAVLAIAAVAAIAAAFLMRSLSGGEAEVTVVAEPAPEAPSAFVLSASRDLGIGTRLTPEDLTWAEWPENAVSPNFILRDDEPGALEDYVGAVVRADIAGAEPLLPRKVVHAGDAGFMAAILSPGMRAVAIPISVERGAGGFILPNDRVDILLTREEPGAPPFGYVTQTILENVKVLAIDQTYADDEEEEQVVIGSTATLELTPQEAELIGQARAAGTISLSLRSIGEGGEPPAERSAQLSQAPTASTIQVYRYGGSQQIAVQDRQERAQ